MTQKSICTFLVAMAVLCVFAVPSGGNEVSPPDVKAELNNQMLLLRVTIHSRSESSVSLPMWRLPWGRQQLVMHLVPVDSVGACIGNKYVREEYPDYRKVTIEPNGSLTGEIDLRREIPELDEALKKSEVHLFWFYKPPEELHIGQDAGGWVLIPRRK
jgi:hypothetical protein